MDQEGGAGGSLSTFSAVAACTAMAVFYVAILHSPTLILRVPPHDSFKSFTILRFVCAAISSVVSLLVCFLILPIKKWDASILLGVYGIRMDHFWQALAFPLLLTSFMYFGSFVTGLMSMVQESSEHLNGGGNLLVEFIKRCFLNTIDWLVSRTSCVSSWRDYVVAPLTEELVFRACMIPLLLCGGFNTYTVIFLGPIFFSLAHLNHLPELCVQKKCRFVKACRVVGFKLGYTAVFGVYASFLLVRTGHLAAPLVAHMFCNIMGLPVIFSRSYGIIASVAFVMGVVSFFWIIFPLSSSTLYNDELENCECWHRYCDWS